MLEILLGNVTKKNKQYYFTILYHYTGSLHKKLHQFIIAI